MKWSIALASFAALSAAAGLASADPVRDVGAATNVRFAPASYHYAVNGPFGELSHGDRTIQSCMPKPGGLEIVLNPVTLGFVGLDVPLHFQGRVVSNDGTTARIVWTTHETNLGLHVSVMDGTTTHPVTVNGADGQFTTDVTELATPETEQACAGTPLEEIAEMRSVGGDADNHLHLDLSASGFGVSAELTGVRFVARLRVPPPPPAPPAGQLASVAFFPGEVCEGHAPARAHVVVSLDNPARGRFPVSVQNESGPLAISTVLVIPDGRTSATFEVAIPPGFSGTDTVAATAGGITQRATLGTMRDFYRNGCHYVPPSRPPPYILKDPQERARWEKVHPGLARALEPHVVLRPVLIVPSGRFIRR